MPALTLDLSPVLQLSRPEFYQICAANPDLKLERTATGALIVMAPTDGETSHWNAEINVDLGQWNRQAQTGKTFDSSGGFSLPQGSDRSPDAAWIPLEKWNSLSPEERQGFLPLCPDFVIELVSPTDSWKQTQAKMEEYLKNGCRLGWLIDPKRRRVAIYRAGQSVEILTDPEILSGETVLPGFTLNLRSLLSES